MSQRLYAIVLRLAALHPGAIPVQHGELVHGALLKLIQHGDSPLAQRLHDDNNAKPFTISLLHGGRVRPRHQSDGRHFGAGDTADWRFTLLMDPAFDALLRRYLLNRDLPHVQIGSLSFAIQDAFASGMSHPDSGHVSLEDLVARWNCPPSDLARDITLDFMTPTAFNFGKDPIRQEYRIHTLPDAKTVFSTLRRRWQKMGGIEPGDVFDVWLEKAVETEILHGQTETMPVKNRAVAGFTGRVCYSVYGSQLEWLPLLHLLADLSFWTGIGYQTTQGMGQVRLKTLD